MLLGGRFLTQFTSVNDWDDYSQEVKLTEGNPSVQTVQLLDVSFDKTQIEQGGLSSPGRRYMPVEAATMTVTFINVGYQPGVSPAAQKTFIRSCTRPAPPVNATTQNDASIWQFTILPTDPLRGTVALVFTLTEGNGNVSTFRMDNALLIGTTAGC